MLKGEAMFYPIKTATVCTIAAVSGLGTKPMMLMLLEGGQQFRACHQFPHSMGVIFLEGVFVLAAPVVDASQLEWGAGRTDVPCYLER